MLRKIWQRFIRWFQRFLNTKRKRPIALLSPSRQEGSNQIGGLREPKRIEQPQSLDNADYEYLFMQLLEGVEHGWNQSRVLTWFDSLKNRISDEQWMAWLRNFGDTVLASAAPNRVLALGLLQLSEFDVGEIADVAYEIGSTLLARQDRENNFVERLSEEIVVDDDEADPFANHTTGLEHQSPALNQQSADSTEQFPPSMPSEALSNQTDEPEAWYSRATQQYRALNLPAAIASLDKAIAIKPDYHVAWYNRGIALAKLGQLEEALASYDQAIRFKPDYHLAWYNRGVALGKVGQLESAIASYDQAIEYKPDYYLAWYNRGVLLVKLGKLEEAIASYDKAIQFKPDYHAAWYNRSLALKNLGRSDEAQISYDTAKAINSQV